MAPEVLAGTGSDVKYDCKCDVFSAGVIYYLLLTGEQLFVSHVKTKKGYEIDYKQFYRNEMYCWSLIKNVKSISKILIKS